MSSRRPSRRKLESVSEFYTELHEGKEPESIHRELAPRETKSPVWHGERIAEIQYRKKIPGQTPHYWHPHKSHARPALAFTRSGMPVIATGRYEVTTHGIEDLPENRVRRESWPKRPHELIDLGVLEWIKVELPKGHPDGKYREINFESFPNYLLTRDERGNLHVLKQGDREMRHRRHSYMSELNANPHHRRRHHRRRNPTEIAVSRAGAGSPDRGVEGVALGALFVAGSGLVSMELVRIGLAQFFPSGIITQYPVESGAVAKMLSGVGLGAVARSFGAQHAVVAGAAVGPMLDGMHDLYVKYLANTMGGIVQTAQRALGLPVRANPNAMHALPSGMPSSFQARTPQQCKVA
jgi:hypothetical protein